MPSKEQVKVHERIAKLEERSALMEKISLGNLGLGFVIAVKVLFG